MVWALIGGLALAGLGAIIWLARREGRKDAEADAAREQMEDASNAARIDEEVAGTPESELDAELERLRRRRK